MHWWFSGSMLGRYGSMRDNPIDLERRLCEHKNNSKRLEIQVQQWQILELLENLGISKRG